AHCAASVRQVGGPFGVAFCARVEDERAENDHASLVGQGHVHGGGESVIAADEHGSETQNVPLATVDREHVARARALRPVSAHSAHGLGAGHHLVHVGVGAQLVCQSAVVAFFRQPAQAI